MERSNIMIPGVRFKRVAEAFDEALIISSGSEHFPSRGDYDLSDLVNSFIEKGLRKFHDPEKCDIDMEEELEENDQGKYNSGCDLDETKEILEGLLSGENDQDGDGNSMGEIVEQRELIIMACDEVLRESYSSSEKSEGLFLGFSFKRMLMSRLRDRGFDAGICKSRWPKSGRHPGGEYEYIDINVGDQKRRRYIVEINLSSEFEIARPTTQYSKLLNIFPSVFVGQPEDIKQVVRLMSRGIRESMKGMNLKVPPWRSNGYMQAKWFSPYKRTTNEIPSSHNLKNGAVASRKLINNGFEVLPMVRACTQLHCKEDFVGKKGGQVGYLSAAFGGDAY